MNQGTKLKVENIEKSFPGVKALQDINFEVEAGTVHVLCGENGAGKSTLMKVINGIHKPDQGKIYIDGVYHVIKNPIQARALGISMIFQELNYIPEMTIEESLVVGTWPSRNSKVDWKAIRENAIQLLKSEGLDYDPTTKLKDLTVSDIQMLEILKAISYNSDIIIMDEPTSAITDKEVAILFKKIEELKRRGTAIVYISHKMDEIFKIADQITILRDGIVVDSRPVKAYDLDTVIAQMVGRKLENSFPVKENIIGESLLEVQGLSHIKNFKDVSFNLKRGEIVGFAGLMGAGRTEVMRCLFGLDESEGGQVKIDGKAVNIRSAKQSIEEKMVMLSEDRRRFGIIPVRSIRENVVLSSLKSFIFNGYLHRKKERSAVEKYCGRMAVKAPDYETAIETLSGGNQQKVILAKWMVTNPEILILDEPTRGIDVGAKYEIYKLMCELADEGKGLIMVSSELPELIGMCDRIYVMAHGHITGELQRNEFTQEAIMKLATS